MVKKSILEKSIIATSRPPPVPFLFLTWPEITITVKKNYKYFFSCMSSSSLLLKPGISFILFKKRDKILYNASVNITVNQFIEENWPNNSTLRNCATNSNFDWVQGSFFKDVRVIRWPDTIILWIYITRQIKPRFIWKKKIVDIVSTLRPNLLKNQSQ